MACNTCKNNCTCKYSNEPCRYEGPNIDCVGIVTGDSIETAISKITANLCSIPDIGSLDEILCGADVVIPSGTELKDAIPLIVSYFCTLTTPPSVPILCGSDVVVPIGTGIVDSLTLIVQYFCNEVANINSEITTINNEVIDGSTVNFVDTLDLNGCTIRSFTIELLSGATVIETINFATPAICPRHIIEDEGTPLTERDTINFVGDGVTVTDTGFKTEVNIPGTSFGAWQVLPGQNSWTASILEYCVSGDLVLVRGTVDKNFTSPGGYSDDLITTLPVGFRPSAPQYFYANFVNTTSAYTTFTSNNNSTILLDTDGTVRIRAVVVSSPGPTENVILNFTLQFRAEL